MSMSDPVDIHDQLCVPMGDRLVRHARFLASDGAPLDISDPHVSIGWQIITSEGSKVLTKKTGDLGITVMSAGDGLVRLVLTAEETRAFAPGIYRDTVLVTFPGGVFARTTGRIEIMPALP